MQNLECLFINVFSLDCRFIFGKQEAENQTPDKSEKAYMPKGNEKWDAKRTNKIFDKCAKWDGNDRIACRLSGMKAEEVKKMGIPKMQELFLRPAGGTDGKVVYNLDFHSNQDCEQNIRLDDLFKAEFLLVKKNPSDDGVFVDKGKDGKYYERGTKNPVQIATGYQIVVPYQDISFVSGAKW